MKAVACEVVRVIVPFGNARICCRGRRDHFSKFFNIQILGDEFSVIGQVLLRFVKVRLEGFYPMESGFQVFRGSSGSGPGILLIGPIARLGF